MSNKNSDEENDLDIVKNEMETLKESITEMRQQIEQIRNEIPLRVYTQQEKLFSFKNVAWTAVVLLASIGFLSFVHVLSELKDAIKEMKPTISDQLISFYQTVYSISYYIGNPMKVFY